MASKKKKKKSKASAAKKNSASKMKKSAAEVAIVMGSQSDLPVMKAAAEILKEFKVSFSLHILSAHRTPTEMATFAQAASGKGYRVVIAGAGGAAHLPGMIASLTELPVVGVPVPIGPLAGQDALLSIAQMPTGVPVATVAIGNATNAGLLAVQILATGSDRGDLRKSLVLYKEQLRERVKGMQKSLKLKSK